MALLHGKRDPGWLLENNDEPKKPSVLEAHFKRPYGAEPGAQNQIQPNNYYSNNLLFFSLWEQGSGCLSTFWGWWGSKTELTSEFESPSGLD